MSVNAAIDKKALSRLRIFIMSVFALTIVGIILRTFSFLFFYDPYIGYFSTGALLPVFTHIFFFICTVVILVFVLFFSKDIPYVSGCESTPSVKLSSALCAVLSFVVACLHLVNWIFKTSLIWTYLIPALLILSAVYFFLNVIRPTASFMAWGAIALVFVFVCYLAMSYFDAFIQMNSPNKIMMHMSCLALMLFFLSEARSIAGIMKKKLYVFSVAVAVFFAGVESIPSIIAVIFNKIPNPDYLTYDIFLCSVLVYLVIRASIITKDKESDENIGENSIPDTQATNTDNNNDEITDLQEGI